MFIADTIYQGKYSKLAQLSRNTLIFVEYFQSEIQKEKKGKKYIL